MAYYKHKETGDVVKAGQNQGDDYVKAKKSEIEEFENHILSIKNQIKKNKELKELRNSLLDKLLCGSLIEVDKTNYKNKLKE